MKRGSAAGAAAAAAGLVGCGERLPQDPRREGAGPETLQEPSREPRLSLKLINELLLEECSPLTVEEEVVTVVVLSNMGILVLSA
ncbi:hypothetical protein J1605_014365 [Eschrichtius robustus]|uniref:Uncharacterized protein n=1 Tax=Eschrichtius robustus TaxID=9764 RepID=A0AB34GF54_ESCRO|nr:hypothetical protein J1605_014365 [Eschrichtius robustus]